MKEKTIEKIPYLGLRSLCMDEKAEYIGVTALKDIAGERHFFLEVYKNEEGFQSVPVVRIAVTKKDFGTYFPESGTWSRKICVKKYNQGLLWEKRKRWRSSQEKQQENVLYSPEDLVRIKKFFEGVHVWEKGEWWEYVKGGQKKISEKEWEAKRKRKYEQRKRALEERKAAVADLPEKEILEYAGREIFKNNHYLYYKKGRTRAVVACSSCGQVREGRWKDGQSFESRFEKQIWEPRANHYGECPNCGVCGKYLPQGKARSVHMQKGYLFLGQRYRKTGMVFRYIQVEKRFELELAEGEKGPEMCGAREVLCGVETARIFFEAGKNPQIDYQKQDYTGKGFWDDCNLSGGRMYHIEAAGIMPETYENMKGTMFQYSALKEYEEAVGEVNPAEYLERYLHTPQIEMLVKLRLIEVVKNLVRCRYGIVQCENARRPDEFLGIRKERVRLLMEKRGDLDLLEVMQMEKRMGASWTEEQVRNLAELRAGRGQIELATQYMSLQKMLNRVAFYAGCEFGTKCSRAGERLRQTATTYFDYLHLREQLGYSLENSVYLYPRDLRAAHDKMVAESNEKEQEKRLEETAGRFPLIRKQYRRLRKKYFYEDEEYCIRPARSAEEIVLEGRFLHHCVGGDNYLRRHNDGERFILMLRSRKEPDIPYITVEIDREDCILQWYGANDKKPDKERMQSWIDAYTTRLKLGGSGRESEKEEIRILAAG